MALCSNAFAPWEARESAGQKRHEHLISLFHKAARVGVLIFSQPSTFLFDWEPSHKAKSTMAIQVWPRLLRTTNAIAESLPKPQVIVEGSSQHIGVEITTSHPLSSDSAGMHSHRVRDSTDVYDAYGMTRQDKRFARPAQPHTFGGPSELAAPQGFVSATVQGPHDSPYLPRAANQSEQRDQDPGYRDIQSPQTPPYPYPTSMHSERRDQDRESRGVHPITTSPQYGASDQNPYSCNMQSKPNPASRKPMNDAPFELKE